MRRKREPIIEHCVGFEMISYRQSRPVDNDWIVALVLAYLAFAARMNGLLSCPILSDN